jgi:hypothetical protein
LPPDKKLSKIEILKLAICYIAYLNHVLDVWIKPRDRLVFTFPSCQLNSVIFPPRYLLITKNETKTSREWGFFLERERERQIYKIRCCLFSNLPNTVTVDAYVYRNIHNRPCNYHK